MKLVITGGSGQVGTILARAFHQTGHEVVVVSRKPVPARWQTVQWDAQTLGDWTKELEGAEAVINLAGYTVNCRYNVKNRQLIKGSRVQSTRLVGAAIAQASRPPHVWLQASTATIYDHRYDKANDEASGIIGGSQQNAPDSWRFSLEVATSWEQAMHEAKVATTRKVLLRSAMVMSADQGGVFDVLLRLVRYGLGGKMGNGQQYISWMHEQDFVRAVVWLIEHEEIEGAVNLAAPAPLPNAEFMRILREAWGMRVGLPATEWMLEIGALALRTETELVLKSRRVVPGRLLESGFSFDFPEWAEAARDLCQQWRERSLQDKHSSKV